MGTLDHALALHHQIIEGGGISHMALGDPSLTLPDWFCLELRGAPIITDPLQQIEAKTYDAVVIQVPYDELRDPAWSELDQDDAFIVYPGYAVWMVDWEHGAHGLPFFARCSLVLAASTFSRDGYLAAETRPSQAIWSGDPLMYDLLTSEHAPTGSGTILWAPHWAEKWVDERQGFASWKDTVHDVLKVARGNRQVRFIVRGHPLMIVGDGDDSRTRRAAKSYRQLLALENVEVSTASMKEDILRSSALLTDGVSIIAYFGVTERPLAVVRLGNRWPPYNAAGKALVNASDTIVSRRDLRRWLRNACRGVLPHNPEPRELVEQLYPLREASPGSLLLEELHRRAS
jgi:CDP-glycerol glycerophosphotransferase (TagB/SpsB family)